MGNFEDWKCDSCHEWNESVAKWKFDYKTACKWVEDRDATIAQQAQELEAKDKRIAELEGALTAIRDRFKDKLSLHKEDCFAYQQVMAILSNTKGEG